MSGVNLLRFMVGEGGRWVLAAAARILPGRCLVCDRKVRYSWRRTEEWVLSRYCIRCLHGEVPGR